VGLRHDRALDGMRLILDGEVKLREDAPAQAAEGPDLDSAIASNETFVKHGEHLRSRLVAFVHGDAAVRREDVRDARAWQRKAFRISRGPASG
jgi:hypothetical protein